MEELKTWIQKHLVNIQHCVPVCVCVCVCVCACALSHVQLFVTLWTVAHQASLSMEFSSQEYSGGLPCPPPLDLPNPGMEPMSLGLLHGRWILYLLSHLESPHSTTHVFKIPAVVP